MSKAYYNEIDPFAAAWLRELIKKGHIAPGDVDERSIEDVKPKELSGYTQHHFFAGIGVWSYALRQAGWPDDRPVWTASCPCQPFSAAGKSVGFDDERHLWPILHWLIEELRPTVIFGEQVASKAAEPWIDLVQVDLEAMDYAFGCVPFPSAGVGAPHIRDRAYWVADSNECGQSGSRELGQSSNTETGENREVNRAVNACGRLRVAEPNGNGRHQGCEAAETSRHRHTVKSDGSHSRPSPTNGFWRDADWLGCRDGKWRPVEPGTLPLVDGPAARVGRLRGYGNAINAEAAKAFIGAYLDAVL